MNVRVLTEFAITRIMYFAFEANYLMKVVTNNSKLDFRAHIACN